MNLEVLRQVSSCQGWGARALVDLTFYIFCESKICIIIRISLGIEARVLRIRGDLVILEPATALDFEFLNLDAVSPPMRRDPDQDAKDSLCQRLLLLSAKWFDSLERARFVHRVVDGIEPEILALEAGEAQMPTKMERGWVSVGYPTSGGLWIAEYNTFAHGMQETDNVPVDAMRVSLAKTMDVKCEILKSIGAKFFASLEQYDGAACLRAWEEKTQGEVGPLVQTQYEEEPGKM